MQNKIYDKEPGLGGDFPGREKQGATHASRGWPGKSPPNLGAGI
jgi:hypothetical protein